MGLVRRGRPLVRTVARTAVIAGTATAVSGRVSRRQEGRYAQQEQAQAPAPPAETPAEDPMAQLEKLGQLHAQGVLTDEEFAAQKAKVLG